MGVKVDRKTIRESIDNALKSKVFKANVEVNKIKVPTEVKAKLRIDRTSLSDSISSALNNKKYKIKKEESHKEIPLNHVKVKC